MANKRIRALTEVTSMGDTDVVAIDNTTLSEAKKITKANLLTETTAAIALKEDSANKTTDLSVSNDILFPTTEAVNEGLDLKLNKDFIPFTEETVVVGTDVVPINTGASVLKKMTFDTAKTWIIETATSVLDTVSQTVKGAINELKGDLGDLQTDVGDVTTLDTTSKEVVGAINEVNTAKMSIATYDPTAVGADAFDSANHAYDNSTSGLVATDVQSAIDEVVDDTETSIATLDANINTVGQRVNITEKSIASILDSNPAGSAVLTSDTYAGITSLPANAADAPMKADLSGMTATNIAEDTWATDLAGWTSDYDSIEASKYRITHTSDATGERDISSLIRLTGYYLITVLGKSASDTAGAGFNVINNTGGASLKASTTLTATQTLTLGLILQPSDLTGTVPYLRMTNKGSGYAEFSEFFIVEISSAEYAEGLTALMTKYPYFKKGTVHAGATRFTSLGKNLYDKNTNPIVTGDWAQATSTWNATGTVSITRYLIPVKPSTTYSCSSTAISGQIKIVKYWDINRRYISVLQYGVAFTTPINCYYITIQWNSISNTQANQDLLMNSLQLELGSTATTYEPYVESVTYTPPDLVLRRVPSARDTIERNSDGTQKKVQRVSGATTINGALNWSNFGTYDTNKYYATLPVGYAQSVNMLTATANSGYAFNDVFNDFLWVIAIIATTRYNQIVVAADGRIFLTVSKDYLDANYTGDLAGFKNYLNAHPLTVYYQLATPIETDLPAVPALISKSKGTVIAEACVCDVDIYGTGITVSGKVFSAISKVSILNLVDGTEEDVTADCSLNVGKDGFTCSSASADDYIWYELLVDTSTVANPENNYQYFDSTVVEIDSVTSKVYRITHAIASGTVTHVATELV